MLEYDKKDGKFFYPFKTKKFKFKAQQSYTKLTPFKMYG